MSYTRDTPDGCTLTIRVHPGAKKNAITGLHADSLKVALNVPPIDGRANDALIEFIAERLNLPQSRVALLSGASSRSKVLRITGKSAAEVRAALSPTVDA